MINYDIKYNIDKSLDGNHEIVSIEPLERGFGHTLGNALRRVLLGHLSGAAITRVKIDGIQHEFSALPGVHEDVIEIIHNLKGVNFAMKNPKTTIVMLEASGEGEIKAKDLKCPTGIEVLNGDHHIATLADKKSKLTVEITVDFGKGYQLPDEREKKPVGVIMTDANFSPVVLVAYKVENTRVGRETDLDRLVFDITTDGSVSPKEAIQRAGAILNEYFGLLAGDTSVFEPRTEEEDTADMVKMEKEVYLEELGLPTRVLNTLKKSGFETINDIRNSGDDGLSNVKNIGPKTIKMLLKKVKDAEE